MPKKSYIIDNWKAIYPVLSAEIPKKEQDAYNKYFDEIEKKDNNNGWGRKTPKDICKELGLETDPNFLQLGRYCVKLKDITSKETAHKDDLAYLYNQLLDIEGSLYGENAEKYKKGEKEQENFNFFIEFLIKEEKWQLRQTHSRMNRYNSSINAVEAFQNEHEVKPMSMYDGALDVQIQTLQVYMESVDDNMHINSSAFKAMKRAMTEMSTLIAGDGYVNVRTFGDKLAALHEATLNYVNAKGISNQSTQLGKDRMNFAMEVLKITHENLDKYPTTERYSKFVKEEYGEEYEDEYDGEKGNKYNDEDDLEWDGMY